MWDATGEDTAAAGPSSGPSSGGDDLGADQRWAPIFRNVGGVAIVCTLLGGNDQDGGGDAGEDEHLGGGRLLDRQEVMEHLEGRVRRWMSLVHRWTARARHPGGDGASSAHAAAVPTTLILNKSDLIPMLLSSSDWVRVGAQIERMCERMGITGWYTSTCLPPAAEGSVGGKDQPQDRRRTGGVAWEPWEEDSDGAELALLSLLRLKLARGGGGEAQKTA